MKKMNNKGFSLVELIIVIAIMAILAGAIAPALIRYIDKSRKSNDVSSCKTIKTAVETALGNETVYEFITAATESGYCYIYVTPGQSTAESNITNAIEIKGGSNEATINGKNNADVLKSAQQEIGTNIGETTPKLKYKKNAADTSSNSTPTEFVAVVSQKGTVYVFIACVDGLKVSEDKDVGVKAADKEGFQICPNVCDEYQ